MNYLNKFGNLVNKGFNDIKNNVKSAIDNRKIDSAMYSIHNVSSSSNTKQMMDINKSKPSSSSTSSMSAMLNQLKPSQSNSNTSEYKEMFSTSADTSLNRGNTKKPPEEFMKNFKLIKGESIIEFCECFIRLEEFELKNKLLITTYRVYNCPDYADKKILLEQWNDFVELHDIYPENYFSIPIHEIATCERPQERTNNFKYIIEITSKDGRSIELLFPFSQRDSIYNRINDLVHSRETLNYYSFARKYNSESTYDVSEDGWNLYIPDKEYERQGLIGLDVKTSNEPDKLFRRTLLNDKFGLCESYPKYLITSTRIRDDELRNASTYRTKQRLPMLSYYYSKNKATIWRSSQAKTGLTGNTNESDIRYVRYIAETSPEKKLIVFDARPYLSAAANKLKGAGYERVQEYGRTSIIFCEIDNIHVARNALNKIYSIISHPDFHKNKKFYSDYENTKWNEFTYMIIKAAIKVALAVRQGHATLIHCSDGWDRASQLTAFSQLLIDPYYRTIKGYMTLIEKDFLSFGHQFKCRNGYYGPKEYKEDQNSPILLQYLDATHQLLVNYPMFFEFNMEFLVFVANSIHSGKYGTFLFNNEKEREMKQAKKNTMSVWTEVLRNVDKYMNPFYDKRTLNEFFFCPVFYNHKLRFWEEYFMQYNQLRVNYSYDKYVNRYDDRNEDVMVGHKKQKIFTENMLMKREKKELSHCIKEKDFEIMKLKICLKELIDKKGDINEVSDKTKEVVERIMKEKVCGYEELEKEIKEEEQLEHVEDKEFDLKDKEDEVKEGETEGTNDNKEEELKEIENNENNKEEKEGNNTDVKEENKNETPNEPKNEEVTPQQQEQQQQQEETNEPKGNDNTVAKEETPNEPKNEEETSQEQQEVSQVQQQQDQPEVKEIPPTNNETTPTSTETKNETA